MIPRRKPFFAPNSFFNSFKADTREIKNLEQALATKLSLPNPTVVASGRVGLKLILENAGIKRGGEVIMPGYTFGLLTKVIKSSGFIPKPVDIDPQTFQMAPKAVQKAITKKTVAILATHIFGEPCDILTLKKIATKHKLLLIEDCAEALGASTNGRMLGTFGNFGIGSFNIAKPIQGITGGVIFGKDKKFMKKIRQQIFESQKNGQAWKDSLRGIIGYVLTLTPFWFLLMYIFSFEKLQKKFINFYRKSDSGKGAPGTTKVEKILSLAPSMAFIARKNLDKFEVRLKKRREIRNLYYKLLGKQIDFQKIEPKNLGSVYMIVGKSPHDPFELRRFLALKGIDIAIGPEIADNCLNQKGSNANFISPSAIALPIYENLKRRDIKYVANSLNKFTKNIILR